MTTTGAARPRSLSNSFSTFLYQRPRLVLALLLVPPLLWLGIIYLGSLFTLLAQSFFSIDDFTAQTIYEPTLATYARLFTATNLSIIFRTLAMWSPSFPGSSPFRSPTTSRALPAGA